MRRAGLSYGLSRAVMDGDAEQASRCSRDARSRASRRAARVWQQVLAQQRRLLARPGQVADGWVRCYTTMQRSLLQDKGATSRVGAIRVRGTTAGAAKRLRARRRRKQRIDREEKMAEKKLATSWRWGVGEKAAKMPVEAGTRDWPRQRSPPMVP